MEKLLYLLKLTQEKLKIEVYTYLRQKKMNPIYEDGFVYAEGDIPILLVAHMDTVFDETPKKLFYNKREDKISNQHGGLGGDDRCGIYIILQLLETFRPYVLFTEDEEIGCIGAQKTVERLEKPNVKYIIEFDRRGKDDCVFYDCGNEKFIHYIESFGFKTEYGTCSDISILGSVWNIASVNLSSGYYHEHTEKEYIIFNQLQKTAKRVKSMLKRHKKAPYFDYQKMQYALRYSAPIFEDWSGEDFIRWFEPTYRGKNTSFQQDQYTGKKLTLKKEENSDYKKRNK